MLNLNFHIVTQNIVRHIICHHSHLLCGKEQLEHFAKQLILCFIEKKLMISRFFGWIVHVWYHPLSSVAWFKTKTFLFIWWLPNVNFFFFLHFFIMSCKTAQACKTQITLNSRQLGNSGHFLSCVAFINHSMSSHSIHSINHASKEECKGTLIK